MKAPLSDWHRRSRLLVIKRGFALLVTLTLMVLRMVLIVGMLTLAGVSMRTASQADALATARANARLALQLAIGDLQKSLGPDRAR